MFFWLSVHLVSINLWLFSKNLTKMFQRALLVLCFLQRENKVLEICNTPFFWLPILLIYPRSVVKIHIHSSVGLSFKDLWSESESDSVMSDSLGSHGLYSAWNSPGQNTGVGSRSLLQGNLPNPGIKPRSPACRLILYQLSHKGILCLYRCLVESLLHIQFLFSLD